MIRDFYQGNLDNILSLPYTITFVLRKRKQYMEIMKLPEDKRPPEALFWLAPPEDLEEWLDRVLESKSSGVELNIDDLEFG